MMTLGLVLLLANVAFAAYGALSQSMPLPIRVLHVSFNGSVAVLIFGALAS